MREFLHVPGDSGGLFYITGYLNKCEWRFFPVPTCSSRIVSPHLTGTPTSHAGKFEDSFTSQRELTSFEEPVVVTDCCPLPLPQAIGCEWRWWPVSLWSNFTVLPQVTGSPDLSPCDEQMLSKKISGATNFIANGTLAPNPCFTALYIIYC
jgi:hypothetical protein